MRGSGIGESGFYGLGFWGVGFRFGGSRIRITSDQWNAAAAGD